MNIETNCCENMLITCFTSCLEVWNVIWEMRFKFVFCLRLFKTIRSRDHAWSFHRQFFWSFNRTFDEWRILIFDYRVTNACFRFVERRMFILDLSSDVYDETSLNLTKRFIKFIVSDSSNLTKTIYQIWWMKTSFHQIWRKRFSKFDERNVISSSRISTSSHQTFWTERQFFYFLRSDFATTFDVKNLILQKIIFCAKINICVKIVVINKRF
jgi:hypothetical protein